MTPEAILAQPARVLTRAQSEHYFTHGYVSLERLGPPATVVELVDVTA